MVTIEISPKVMAQGFGAFLLGVGGGGKGAYPDPTPSLSRRWASRGGMAGESDPLALL